jgi:hypothetical protein
MEKSLLNAIKVATQTYQAKNTLYLMQQDLFCLNSEQDLWVLRARTQNILSSVISSSRIFHKS